MDVKTPGVEQHPVSVAKKTKVSIHFIVLDLSAFCGLSRVLPSEFIFRNILFIPVQMDQKFKSKSDLQDPYISK